MEDFEQGSDKCRVECNLEGGVRKIRKLPGDGSEERLPRSRLEGGEGPWSGCWNRKKGWDLEKRNDQDSVWGDNRRGRQGVQPG